MGPGGHSKALRALLVEDSANDADLILRELKRGGFDVTSIRVQTAATMKHQLATGTWDLIVSDFSMPTFDAMGALSVLRQSGLDIPFIVVSGAIGEATAVEALKSGAHDFVVKGNLSRLLPAVERELREIEVREAGRQAQGALRESEERYRNIVETTNEGVWLIDSDSKTTFVNSRMARLLGYEPPDLLGRSILDFVHEESRSSVAASLGRHAKGGPSHAEVRLNRKDDEDFWALLDSTPMFDASGQYQGDLAMVMDVTARKSLEDQLRQAQKMEAVGSLAGGVAHDFNNLLSIILSYTVLAVDELEPKSSIRADLEEVIKAAERASELTKQLLAFSRRQVLELRVLDLSRILTGLQKMLQRLLGEDVELSLRTPEVLGKVRADRSQVDQVIMNLVVNARDSMPKGGKITIDAQDVELDAAYAASHFGVTPGPYVLLAVTDTGHGMDGATITRIFEPFFTTKERGKGTGLGLSTVFGIVQQSRGHIWVDSEPGHGTTFKVYLPRAHGDAVVTKSLPPPANLRGTETILLVEDEEAVRAVAAVMLRRQGYNVLEAQNGGEAFLLCEKSDAAIHLLVTDVIMPRMSGRELAERLAPMRTDMKVLYMSGYTDDAVVHHGVLELGVAYLQKPIVPDSFLRKVREVLDVPLHPMMRLTPARAS